MNDLQPYKIDKQSYRDLHSRMQPFIHCTPVLRSSYLDRRTGSRLYFKCENFQRMGAFKMRGAMTAILGIPKDKRAAGVVTHSSGNFGQAVALAAREAGIPAFIVMPSNAPQVKKDAVASYDGKITECAPTLRAREEAAALIMQQTGAMLLHPSNDIDVILGQGTAALELYGQTDKIDYLICPVGGGGLLAGCALATHLFAPDTRVIGAEPAQADDAYRSLQSGRIETNVTSDTIADGLRTQLGDKNFPLILAYTDSIIRVEEEDIIHAMRLIWERMKIIVEPSSAIALAAVLKNSTLFKDRSVGIILTGGNVDLTALPF